MVCLFDSLSLMAAWAARFTVLESPPCRGELRRGPPSAKYYLPTPRRISRAAARTSALLSLVSKRSQCRAFAALPTSGNAQSISALKRHAQPLKHPDPIWRFRCRLRLFIRPGLHRRLAERLRSGPQATRPLGSIPLLKASLSPRIIQEVFSRVLNAP